MSRTSTSTTVDQGASLAFGPRVQGRHRRPNSPAAVCALCLLGCAAFLIDAVSGEADLGLGGVVVMALALALTLVQALRAGIGRPGRTGRRAAATGTAASLFVAAFLSSVGVLERMGPQATSSAAFAAGVAVMSLVLLVVLPLALVVFAWSVSQDQRLVRWMRLLPCALVAVPAVGTVAVAVTRGGQELWLQVAAVAVLGALLTAFSAGASGAGSTLAERRSPGR